jgi:hypothetical protein
VFEKTFTRPLKDVRAILGETLRRAFKKALQRALQGLVKALGPPGGGGGGEVPGMGTLATSGKAQGTMGSQGGTRAVGEPTHPRREWVNARQTAPPSWPRGREFCRCGHLILFASRKLRQIDSATLY